MKSGHGLKRSLSRTPDDTMDYDSDDKDSKRKSRNLSEKKRRDQFNLLVNELSSMISTTGRKMDKSTVLKSTISFLKSHNEFTKKSRINEIQEEWKPAFLTNEEFIHLILEAVDGFIIVFSTSGHIYYASESITSLLGHTPSDVVEMSLYDLTISEDKEKLYSILANPLDLDTPVNFSCHLRRGTLKTQVPASYELIHFIGYLRTDEDVLNESQCQAYSEEEETRYVFVGTGRTQTPLLIKEIPLVDLHRTEFTSRHSLEWKFLFLDHRAPPIIGYLPFELLGTSGYEYYHIDDLENVINCHKALMQKGEGTSCHYRFLTKGQQWIWLQTRFYITYHQWNSKPEFVVCTHQVVSYTEVVKQARKGWVPPSTTRPVLTEDKSSEPRPARRKEDSSDCTSMTADSPGSFGSQQRIVAETVDNADQAQFQEDLQKKQTELQIIIDQQQQELRRVSEQLMMAKLGLMQQQHQQRQLQQRGNSPQPSNQVTSCQASSSSMVSSTTTARTGSVIVPTTQSHGQLPHQHHHTYQPDSNSKNI